MSCECEEYICVDAFINPCSDGVELDIVPNYTGNMTGKIWFNGTLRTFAISVEVGERIIIPTELLNENYAHEMRLYNDGTLIDCYRVKTALDYDSGEFTPTPAQDAPQTYVVLFKMGDPSDMLADVYGTPIEVPNSNSIQYSGLIGATLIDVEMASENMVPVEGIGVGGFNNTTGVIAFAQVYSDTFFKVVYKK